MVDLPEEQTAAALRRVAEIGKKRADLLAQADNLTEPLREASIAAARADAGRSRIRELAGVSSKTLYGWLAEAGIEVRTKKKPEDNPE